MTESVRLWFIRQPVESPSLFTYVPNILVRGSIRLPYATICRAVVNNERHTATPEVRMRERRFLKDKMERLPVKPTAEPPLVGKEGLP